MHICGNYKQYYPLSVVYTPPLYNSKQVGKLHLDRSRGKYFQIQTTVLPSFV